MLYLCVLSQFKNVIVKSISIKVTIQTSADEILLAEAITFKRLNNLTEI